MLLAPAALPLLFIIEYAGRLWWYGHNMSEMGAFTLKAFMPTVFGQGKVAQFYDQSYPDAGFWLMVLFAVLLVAASLAAARAGAGEGREKAASAGRSRCWCWAGRPVPLGAAADDRPDPAGPDRRGRPRTASWCRRRACTTGSISLDFPLTIDGDGLVTIDAGGRGSVVYLDTERRHAQGSAPDRLGRLPQRPRRRRAGARRLQRDQGLPHRRLPVRHRPAAGSHNIVRRNTDHFQAVRTGPARRRHPALVQLPQQGRRTMSASTCATWWCGIRPTTRSPATVCRTAATRCTSCIRGSIWWRTTGTTRIRWASS